MLLGFGRRSVLHDTEGAGDGTGDTTATQSSDTDTTQSQGDGTGAGAEPPKTYTQAELDQKLRGQGSAIKDMEAKLATFQAAEIKRAEAEAARKQAEMSDLEKAQEQLAAAEARATDAETARTEAIATGIRDRARTEARSLVAAYGPVKESVLDLIPEAALATGEDGKRTADAATALETWIAENTGSLLKGKPGGTGPAATGAPGARTERKDTFGQNLIDLRNQQANRS
jgi:hypothetical protein